MKLNLFKTVEQIIVGNDTRRIERVLDCREFVQNDLAFQKELLKKLYKRQEKIRAIDGWYLTIKHKNGRPYYYKVRCENHVKKKIFLRASMQNERHELQEAKYIREAIPRCESNIEKMEIFLACYRSIEPDDVIKSLGKAYQEQENIRKLIGTESVASWTARQEREKNNYEKRCGKYKPNGLIHRASDGCMLRSKSELAIKECLISLGIPHVYEPAKLVAGILLHPDFIAYNTRTKEEFYIEHVGYLVDPQYRTNYIEKLEIYDRAGYTPNSNLLLTYEDRAGHIDFKAIMTLLKAYLK